MAAGSDLPPSVAGAIGLPRVAPTREFLGVMRDLWKAAMRAATTVAVSDAGATYDQAHMQELVDAVRELQERNNGG